MVVLECIYGTQTLFNPYRVGERGDVCTQGGARKLADLLILSVVYNHFVVEN